jgi:hypothetical protein
VITDATKARRLKLAGLLMIFAGVVSSVGALVARGPSPVVPGGGVFVILGIAFLARSRRLDRTDS